ncbi:DUF948 domain-containing protein [Paenibacillus validus]|uniref:DUF948 domain-containing protein n=1 Tax=Paenibacillus validus TaxID=44253 RepID=A0A7X2ZAS8_9BACL|nr:MULTISPECIES: DUF948 domain-containing protein [Paenibacillus]MED4602530.1 DUF948 domain-containing protein [Paenibacillus validus]MED4607839.1 DUF948 domain-containing protein [Paenibacillus validus]MUG71478.1 DUF948 domain-containing protein [Paenibacillus validus]
MWWQWGLAFCMVAFLAVSVTFIRFLLYTHALLRLGESSIDRLQKQALHTVQESERVIEASVTLIDDLQHKLDTVDAWFQAANETGEAVRRVTRSIGVISQTVEDTVLEAKRAVHSRQDTVNELIEWTMAGLAIASRFQASRQSKSKE